jgi:hypothetical protein
MFCGTSAFRLHEKLTGVCVPASFEADFLASIDQVRPCAGVMTKLLCVVQLSQDCSDLYLGLRMTSQLLHKVQGCDLRGYRFES